jgi:hypothetical protein
VINNALAAAEKGNVPENDDLFDHDVHMGNNEDTELPTSRNLTPNPALSKVASPFTAALITRSMRSAASSASPNVSVHVSLPSTKAVLLSETQEVEEATTSTPTEKKATEEEASAASSGSTSAQVSGPFSKSVSPDVEQGSGSSINDSIKQQSLNSSSSKEEETQATATETETAEAASLHLASPDNHAAAGTSPSAVPSLDQDQDEEDEEEEPYDASESASAAGQSDDSASFADNKPLWSRHFVGSERQGDEENKSPAAGEEKKTKVKVDASDEAFSSGNLAVPTEKSRGDRSRSYTSVSEVE